ncbi:hypothetical protein [Halobacillus amylolyticus]|uniref:Uncharacterized protein n=1 Tax=Halobacillus amylolyticus TaxID=2932259 RepID=A0ABY4H5Y4_9BACI|nr:hypothetical protein [Halobacillus amylolyticus]UOR10269.1 hypothetical protein MUO15_11115 [Halobacillus amylolyticus]
MNRQTKLITEHTSKRYLIGVSVMAMALLFFLFSGFLFGDESRSKVQQTPLDEPLNLRGAGELEVENWVYNPSKELMVVTLNIDKSTSLLNDKLSFVAQEKEHPRRKIPTTVEYQNDGRYVISIQQVSPSFDVMALDINKEETNNLTLKEDEQNSSKGGEESNQLARIYTDQSKVKTDLNLGVKTMQEYELAALSQEVKKTKETIKEKDESIQSIGERLEEIDQKIVELESERLYETKEEKEQTDAQIRQLKNEKERLHRDSLEYKTAIKTLKEKLKMLKEKQRMISN